VAAIGSYRVEEQPGLPNNIHMGVVLYWVWSLILIKINIISMFLGSFYVVQQTL
jgi:hypothetical protein